MQLVYRDEIGYILVNLGNDAIIDFLDGYCYFMTENGKDYKIPMSNIVRIGGKEA